MAERLGILGGTFDPVHCGHVLLAQYVREHLDLDRVLLIPAADPPHKDTARLSTADHRWAMTQLALDGIGGLEPSRLEIDRGGTSYTVDTLRQLAINHSDTELFLIIGADNVCDLSTWSDPEGILAVASVVAGARRQVAAGGDESFADRIIHLDTPLFEISSTDLRQRLRDGRPIRYLVPPAVEDYIRDHGLYTSGTR